jgi:hypothetical protein
MNVLVKVCTLAPSVDGFQMGKRVKGKSVGKLKVKERFGY